MAYFIPVSNIELRQQKMVTEFLGTIADEQNHAKWSGLVRAFGPLSYLQDEGLKRESLSAVYPDLPDTTVLTPKPAISAVFFSGLSVCIDEGSPFIRAIFNTVQLERRGTTLALSQHKGYLSPQALHTFASQPPSVEFNQATRALQARVLSLMDSTKTAMKEARMPSSVTLLGG